MWAMIEKLRIYAWSIREETVLLLVPSLFQTMKNNGKPRASKDGKADGCTP
jgi:hypothetical protein